MHIYIVGLHNNSHWIPERSLLVAGIPCPVSGPRGWYIPLIVMYTCSVAYIGAAFITFPFARTVPTLRFTPCMPRAILWSGGPESSPRGRERERENAHGATTRLRYKLPAGNELCPCTSRCFFGGIARRAMPCRAVRTWSPYVCYLAVMVAARRWYHTSLDTNSRSPRSFSISLSARTREHFSWE